MWEIKKCAKLSILEVRKTLGRKNIGRVKIKSIKVSQRKKPFI